MSLTSRCSIRMVIGTCIVYIYIYIRIYIYIYTYIEYMI